ncbi:MAG: phosphopantetheine-binding protein [Actinomycetes bacterium]|jgi:acyl carrier protein|nr:phosphopantetheine-binding protein [Actinomycetes bacterium]
METIEYTLGSYIERKFGLENNPDNYSTDLFATDIIDSLGAAEFFDYIETNWHFTITPDEAVETPLETINEITDFIKAKTRA